MIPISEITKVVLEISPSIAAPESFGTVLFLTTEDGGVLGARRSKEYVTLADLEADFGVDSEAAIAAGFWYAQGAEKFQVGLIKSESRASTLQGGFADLEEIQAVEEGGFTIQVGESVFSVTGLDFTLASDMSEVVDTLNDKLASFGVIASDVGGRITLTRITDGAETIEPLVDSVGGAVEALGLGEDVAVVTAGETPETLRQAASEVTDEDDSYLMLAFHRDFRDTDEVVDLAMFAEASDKILLNTTNRTTAFNPLSTSNIGLSLMEKSLKNTLTTYSSFPAEYPELAAGARAAIVNFDGIGTTITLAHKVLAGVTVEKLKNSEWKTLKERNMNAVINLRGNFRYEYGVMASGNYFDTIHGSLWLKSRIQSDVSAQLMLLDKIAYTDEDIGILVQTMANGLEQAITNGLGAPGYDDAGVFFPLGYEITAQPVSTVAIADKKNRIYKGLGFKLIGAGALHQVEIYGKFVE